MSAIQMIDNELRETDPELAVRFEAEIREAAAAFGVSGECRISVDRTGDGAIDRVNIVLTRPDKVVEWRMALPVVPDDVRLAAESAFHGRTRTERRRTARTDVDRRGKP